MIQTSIPADRLTQNWESAIQRFASSEIGTSIFGAEYCKVYTAVRMDEMQQLSHIIPAIEYKTYLSRL